MNDITARAEVFTKGAVNILFVGLELAAGAWFYHGLAARPLVVLILALIAGGSVGALERARLGLSRPWLLVPEANPESLALLLGSWQGQIARILRWATYALSLALGLGAYRSFPAGLAGVFTFEAVRELIGVPAICWLSRSGRTASVVRP